MTPTLAAVAGSPAVVNYVLPTASLLTAAVLAYTARFLRKFLGEHDWLMRTQAEQTRQIEANMTAIKELLEQIRQERQSPVRRRMLNCPQPPG